MNSHVMSPQPRGHQPAVTRVVLLGTLTMVCGVGLVSSTAQSASGEKELERVIPAHLPIKVEVKNWEKVKQSENEKWLDDFEVEVTNTGTKPIYFLYLSLSLPDVVLDGGQVGYQLCYGRLQLVSLEETIQPNETSLPPGGSVVLKPRAGSVKGWKAFKAKGMVSDPRKLKLTFQLINFGDGTGYVGPGGSPKPGQSKVR